MTALPFSVQISFLNILTKRKNKESSNGPKMTPINPKERETDDYSENGDKRMDIRHLLLNDKTYQVIELGE